MRNKQSTFYGAEKLQCVDVISTDLKVPNVLPCGRDALQNPGFSFPGSGHVMFISGINKELWLRLPKCFLVTMFLLYIRIMVRLTEYFVRYYVGFFFVPDVS